MDRPYPRAGGAFLAASPAPLATITWIHGALPDVPDWTLAVAIAATSCFALAGLMLPRHPHLGRPVASLGLTCALAASFVPLWRSPALTLVVFLVVTLIVRALWARPDARAHGPRGSQDQVLRARGASAAAVLVWAVSAFVNAGDKSPVTLLALATSELIPLLLIGQWLVRQARRHHVRAAILGATTLLAAASVAVLWGAWGACLGVVILVPALALVILPVREQTGMGQVDWWEPVLGHPERLLAATFFGLGVAGTLLLTLPASSATDTSIHGIDAAFTAVSAVCVTGLGVLDTPTAFSGFGQVVILVLIQLGGLGIMTFSTAAMRILGRRMSLRHEGAVAGLLSPQDRGQLFSATRRLIAFTLAAELIGAMLLLGPFLGHGDSVPMALWRALFTAVSAFCNAGFALQTTSLIPYQTNAVVLHTVALLIIAGGLSPAAVVAIPALMRPRRGPVSAQIKIALTATALLLVIGFVAILVLEWNRTLASLSIADRLHNAWFQSVTLRTAGFNSIDLTAVAPATLSLMILWMFIGGSPGGTAGGIKTTTLSVLLLAVLSAVSGRWIVNAFGRRISHKTVYKAAAIATMGATLVFVALLCMLVTQAMPTHMAFFEVVSALGTVGLTIGGTSALDGVGKVIIIVLMFVGRIGPLTLFMFLGQRSAPMSWARPEEEIDVT